MQYLTTKGSKCYHLFENGDTACKLWSTGGIRRKKKAQTYFQKPAGGKTLCTMCRTNHAKRTAKEFANRPKAKTVFLNVPYREKDLAKNLGAKWNAVVKKWYITSNHDLAKFYRWMPHNYEIAKTPFYNKNHGRQSSQKAIDNVLEHLEFFETCPIEDHPVLGECRFVGENPFYWTESMAI